MFDVYVTINKEQAKKMRSWEDVNMRSWRGIGRDGNNANTTFTYEIPQNEKENYF